MRNFDQPGRSTAYALNGMAATSCPEATLAALDILKRGGNAVDAAIAAAAMLCITEPGMTGIGGDCLVMLAWPDGQVRALNGAGRSAAAATPEWLATSGLTEIALDSVHAVTVPGAIDAWCTLLEAYGKFDLATVLQPAIERAEQGTPVLPRVALDWPQILPNLASYPGLTKHYTRDGTIPKVGDLMAYPALAQTLRTIAKGGRSAFYEGPIAADMLAILRSRGSLLNEVDFSETRSTWVEPVATTFENHEILELPPSNQGLTVLLALNILKHFNLKSLEPTSAARHHLEIEAIRQAWAYRAALIGDPATCPNATETMLSPTLAKTLAARIDPKRASALPVTMAPSDTICLCVVDKDRLAVSFMNSLYWLFGSGLVTEKTGITLHNRGSFFVTTPGHPNVIAPRKRPLHTLIPAMAMKEGKVDMAFGVMDGEFQPMGHVNMVLNRYCYGLDPQQSLDLPRLVPEGDKVKVESSVSASVCADLTAMGHNLVPAPEPLGGGQIIAIDHERGLLIGGSDPRKDGCALGY